MNTTELKDVITGNIGTVIGCTKTSNWLGESNSAYKFYDTENLLKLGLSS